MRGFVEAYPEAEMVKQVVSQLPWGHVLRLLQREKDPETRAWYARQAVAQGWSRSILELQMDRRAHERQGQAITNFPATLPPADDLLRHPDDKPTIGLLLCRSKNKIVAEYALRDFNKPIGVAQWETLIVEKLPQEFADSLPTVEELETELGRGELE